MDESYQGCGKTKFAVRLNLSEDSSEHFSWDCVDLVHHHHAPLLLLNPLHRLFGLP